MSTTLTRIKKEQLNRLNKQKDKKGIPIIFMVTRAIERYLRKVEK